VFSRHVAADPRVPDALRELVPGGSHLFVPIVVKDRIIGGLAAVWRDRARELSEGDVALSEAIANQAGVALENVRLFDENRQRVNELSVLYDLSRAVTGQLAHDAVMAAIETHVARVVPMSGLVVVLRSPDADEAPRVYTSVQGVRTQTTLTAGDLPPGLLSVVLDSGRPLRSDEVAAACARHGVAPIAPGVPVRSVLIVPMTIGETTIGALGLGSEDYRFTAADERLVSNIADLAALALSSARLFEDRTRAYRDLAAAQDQLVRTERLRALGEMASGIAHDFNNLLAAILGRAQLLLGRVDDPQLVRWLSIIERSALDGAQTVRRLQEFTRMRRDAPLVPVDLNEIVADALEMTQSRWRDEAQSRGIAIDVETSFSPVPAVAADPAGLREVFTNLILNAVDAMPTGGRLALATGAREAGIEVVVSDTGVGMSETVRERIFDPFFTTKGPQGTGLGLAMAYGIVSRHGATIAVESAEGVGSTFRLSFPLTVDLTPTQSSPPDLPVAVPPLRCLVVDDEESVGSVLGDVLEMDGHEVAVVTDGAAAIERFRAERFDVVFTDLAMPGLSGWQVIRAVKAIAPDVPVFLVSGFAVELSAEERRAHGVEAVLAKPLKIAELRAAVGQAARRRTRAEPRARRSQ
jgi:signal transduction histidine kinase/CheY-like chemotaxis protein